MKNNPLLRLLTLLFITTGAIAADTPAPDPAARLAAIRQLASELKPVQGEITLKGGVAKAVLPSSLRYLDAHDTETVLTKIWGNPKGADTLGMLVPAGFDPLNDESWAVILTFEEDGYVKDNDAAKIDYTKLLTEMKEGVREANAARKKEGYEPIELVGWASPPRYDSTAKKLYWAKELKFGDSPEHTLNYNLRLLGRRGVLVLNAVAGMSQLKAVEAATPSILAAVNFQDGHRYADFKEGTDKTATYGLAALVAGGIAAKTGLLKGLWIAIIALKKFVIIGVIALAAWLRKLWASVRGRNTAQTPVASIDSSPPAV